MSNEFMREERYIVFKMSDLGNSLKGDEIRRLAREYAEHRQRLRKKPLECVVVEKDWPEYEATWKAIEARVTGAQNALEESAVQTAARIMNIELIRECDALRAKIAEMERQEPSETDASVRKSWARFSHELHRSPDAPYPGMSDAFEQHFSQSFTDREWRAEASTWAAAWKAAKRHCAQPALSVPSGLHPLETVRFWADAYTHPGDDNFRGHASAAAVLLREYAELRAALAAAPEAKP